MKLEIAIFLYVFIICFVFLFWQNTFFEKRSTKPLNNGNVERVKYGVEVRSNFDENVLLNQKVLTHTGPSEYRDLKEEVFKTFNYSIISYTFPFVTLSYNPRIICLVEFEDFCKNLSKPSKPPKFLPDRDTTSRFLMNKYSGISYLYSDDRNMLNVTFWRRISNLVTWYPRRLANTLGGDLSTHYAMKNWMCELSNGIVLGSIEPLVELQAIQNGANRIVTIRHTVIDSPLMESITTEEFAKDYQKSVNTFDFAATSADTIENYGLGRFGDALQSEADLHMIHLLRCALRDGGILYVNIPIGIDSIIFNQRRIYGVLRIPMLAAGFKWIGSYGENNETSINLSASFMKKFRRFEYTRMTLVFQKT